MLPILTSLEFPPTGFRKLPLVRPTKKPLAALCF
jgi:hypothetical protein